MNATKRENLAVATGSWVVVGLGALGVGLVLASDTLGVVPMNLPTVVHVLIAAVLGTTALLLIGRLIERATQRSMDLRRASLVLSLYRLAAYTTLALVLLAVAGGARCHASRALARFHRSHRDAAAEGVLALGPPPHPIPFLGSFGRALTEARSRGARSGRTKWRRGRRPLTPRGFSC